MRVAAVILAGGRAERLGGINKALVEIGGRRLVDRALQAVGNCAPVLLSVGRGDFDLVGPVHVGDLPGDYAGPLAGVAAALAHLRKTPPDFLLSLAVDTPFFPADFLARALQLSTRAPCVLSAYADQPYPTNALWRFETIEWLPDEVATGEAPHSLKRLAERIGSVQLDYAHWLADDPFANANTPQELEILRLRAARQP